MGFRRQQSGGFRGMRLSRAPDARARLYDAQSAVLEEGLRKKPQSIIGGQFVDQGDTAGMNAAVKQRDIVGAEANARMAAQGPATFGGNALLPGSTRLGGPQGGVQGDSEGIINELAPLGDPSSIPNPAETAIGVYEGMMAPGGGQGPMRSAGNPAPQKGVADFFADEGGSPNASGFRKFSRGYGNPSTDSSSSSNLSDVFGGGNGSTFEQDMSRRGPQGYQQGGMIDLKKPKMVNQPGMTRTSNIKMPERPQTDVQMEQARMAAEMEMDAGMQEGAARHANPKYPDDAKKQGMRGYQSGGQVKQPSRSQAYAKEVLLGDTSTKQFRAASKNRQFRKPQTQFDPNYDRDKRFDAAEGEANRAAMADYLESTRPQSMRGYACGGKVKKGMAKGGPITDDWQYLARDSEGNLREMPKPEPAMQERPFVPNPKNSIMTETFRKIRHGQAKKEKEKKGMAKGGQIGNEMQDDGRDTVDVGVREGEYLVTPEGTEVIGSMVGGEAEDPYTNGVAFLDEANRSGTGEEPGPVPINEEGEAVRQGMRNGGKMGFIAGGTMVVNEAGQTVQYINGKPVLNQPAMPAVRPPMTAAGAAPIEGQVLSSRTDPLTRGERWERAGARAGNALRNNPAYQTAAQGKNVVLPKQGWKTPAAVAPAVMGGITIADNMTGAKDAYYNDPNVDAWEKAKLAAGELSSTVLPAAGTVVGGTAGSVAGPGGTILGGVGGFTAGALADRGLRSAFGAPASGTEEFNEYAANWTPEQIAEAEQAAAPPGAYGRAFGEGDVNLPTNGLRPAAEAVAPGGMNVVQETGGPGGEVIIREDVNGVPTFTNVRQGGFRGDAATLQAEANARAAEDVGIRQMQAQAVQQMRDNAPIYDQAGVDQRRQENLAMQQTAMEAASRGATSKVDSLRKKVAGHFTQQGTDEDGNLKPGVEDETASRTFIDAMSQLTDPTTGRPMTEVMDGMSQGEMAPFLQEFDRVYRNTQMAQKAGKAKGLPTDAGLRAGVDELRMDPSGREVVFGDAWPFGNDATWGEWYEGLGNDEPARNQYVEDPRTPGLRIPASRVTQDGLDAEAMRKLGLL